MSSMVMELQRDAYEPDVPVSTLLRKAYAMARKLQVPEFEKWALLELNGYSRKEDVVPEYRVANGDLRAWNPYVGFIPVYMHEEIEDLLLKRELRGTLTEIEQLIKDSSGNSSPLMYKFPPDIQKVLMSMTKVDLEISLHIPVTQFQRIVDRVRNTILEWTLSLEESGVFGEGLTFTNMEKKKASETSAIVINNIGNMVNSQLQQNTVDSEQSQEIAEKLYLGDLKSLISQVNQLVEEIQDTGAKQELSAEVAVLEAQVQSPKPKKAIIVETLKSIRNIAEGTAGSLIASGILVAIPAILQSLGHG